MMKYLMASLGGKPLQHRLNFHTKTIEDKKDFTEIKDLYNQPKNIHTIWFNPWESENHQEPMLGLLEELYNHFSNIDKFISKTKKYSSISIQAGLDMLLSLKKFGKSQCKMNLKSTINS